ncbi:efflux RND transporter periplasmic adaptor subunit [Methylobacterium sp. P5_C11]
MSGRRALLLIGGVLLAAACLAATPPGARLRAESASVLAGLQTRVAALIPERSRGSSAPAPPAASRTAVEDGRTLVRLAAPERARIGLVVETRPAVRHRQELTAYGSVLDLARITDLTNSYAGAVAALQAARARVEVSASAARRARNLGAGVVAVAQIETAEGTLLTDQAAVTVADSQLRTLAATARQEWGTVLGKAIIERTPLVTRLIERADFLVQVTLPPGESLPEAPQAAFAEVPPQSERVALRLVSAATRTDPRIQGQSFFYLVSGDSGLLPGTSTMAFLPAPRDVKGILVPEDAVVHAEGGTWVYRGIGDGAFVRHPVRPDAPMSADAFVVEDLPDGGEIVLRGGQALLSEEMKSRIRVVGDDDD